MALLFTGMGLPFASRAAAALGRFLEAGAGEVGDCEALWPVESMERTPSDLMRVEARIKHVSLAKLVVQEETHLASRQNG